MTAARQWWVTASSAVLLGLVVGIPYYALPFFYDYFEAPPAAGGFGWPRSAVVLGLPIGTLVTLAVSPLWARRMPARRSVMGGAVVCAAAVGGFGWMNGSLAMYYALWTLYMVGWSFAGPMTHQVLLARLFEQRRGAAIALAFFGLSLFGAVSVVGLAQPLTQALGPAWALRLMGGCVLLAVPIAWACLPELDVERPAGAPAGSWSVIRRRDFWFLLMGSTLTASGIGGVSQHLKLILRERGYAPQARLDEIFGWTLLLMLAGSAIGRIAFGWCADRYPKRRVLTVAFGLMLVAVPLLSAVSASGTPYLFAICFGLGMSSDTLITALLAAERFEPETLRRAMSLLTPVSAVGQTWFPFAVSLLWEVTGSYTVPLAAISLLILGGRILLFLVPEEDVQSV